MVKNKITLNVLADINRKIGSVGTIESRVVNNNYNRYEKETNQSNRYDDKALVVLTGTNINIDEKLDYLSELERNGVNLSIAFSDMGVEILDVERIKRLLKPKAIYLEEDILKLKDISLAYDYVIAPNITINTMSKITQGYIDGLIPNLIWTFLYLAKDVYIDFESTLNYLGLECKNDRIEEIVLEQIEEIKSIGATEIGFGKYMDTIYKDKHLSNNLGARTDTKYSNDVQKKKVYTQNDINDSLVNGNKLTIARGSILTPLAKDKIKSMGISVNFE